jgi:hypothetical protein
MVVAQVLLRLYLQPKNPQIHSLMRLSILMGHEFSAWLWDTTHSHRHSFGRSKKCFANWKNPTLAWLQLEPALWPKLKSLVAGAAAKVGDLLERPDKAAVMLSKACMCVFQGIYTARSVARLLDCLSYGLEISKRASALSNALIKTIGDHLPGEPHDSATSWKEKGEGD